MYQGLVRFAGQRSTCSLLQQRCLKVYHKMCELWDRDKVVSRWLNLLVKGLLIQMCLIRSWAVISLRRKSTYPSWVRWRVLFGNGSGAGWCSVQVQRVFKQTEVFSFFKKFQASFSTDGDLMGSNRLMASIIIEGVFLWLRKWLTGWSILVKRWSLWKYVLLGLQSGHRSSGYEEG